MNENSELRKRSGSVSSEDPFVGIFYDLLRDHVSPSTMEELVRQNQAAVTQDFSNGYLARYAADLVDRLRNVPGAIKVHLRDPRPKKIQVIKVLRQHLGLGLKDAKDMADNAPVYIDVESREKADALVRDLVAQGAKARVGISALEAMKEAAES